MDFFIIFGVIIVPLFLMGLFAVYKARKPERKEQTVEGGLYAK